MVCGTEDAPECRREWKPLLVVMAAMAAMQRFKKEAKVWIGLRVKTGPRITVPS